MPTHLRIRCSWQYLNADPKNQAVINPCFRRQLDITDPTSGTDAQALTDDLANALVAWNTAIGGTTTQLTVTAYNIQGAKPNYPLAHTTKNAAVYATPNCPPELALCLSFFGNANQPRKRGRLYVPVFIMNLATSSIASATASVATRQKVADLVPKFAALGGANVDWGVWSQRDAAFRRAENWFVDEAWDTVRSRGLASTARTTGTTSG
jgi:hypothetical protein